MLTGMLILRGNLTEDGQGYHYTYDAFGRLTRIWTGAKTIALYRYNGLGHRIAWRYDSNADTEIDGDDPWYFFCYDERWRVVATFRADDEHPKEVFVHHAAGLGGGVGGYGSSSYIDSVIFRDRDIKTKWYEEAEEERAERLYYVQNWRADVSVILTDAGSLVEWVKYSTYGVPYSLPAGDTDSDGDWDATDSANIAGWSAGYDVRADTNLDGVISGADITHANSITGGYQALGRGLLSSPGVNNRRGYAGYEYDPTLEGAGRWLYHVRHRVYDAEVGRWTRRDPLGYVDGLSLYQYVRGMAVVALDPRGLDTVTGGGGGSCAAGGKCENSGYKGGGTKGKDGGNAKSELPLYGPEIPSRRHNPPPWRRPDYTPDYWAPCVGDFTYGPPTCKVVNGAVETMTANTQVTYPHECQPNRSCSVLVCRYDTRFERCWHPFMCIDGSLWNPMISEQELGPRVLIGCGIAEGKMRAVPGGGRFGLLGCQCCGITTFWTANACVDIPLPRV